jgi:hypothetical protein
LGKIRGGASVTQNKQQEQNIANLRADVAQVEPSVNQQFSIAAYEFMEWSANRWPAGWGPRPPDEDTVPEDHPMCDFCGFPWNEYGECPRCEFFRREHYGNTINDEEVWCGVHHRWYWASVRCLPCLKEDEAQREAQS